MRESLEYLRVSSTSCSCLCSFCVTCYGQGDSILSHFSFLPDILLFYTHTVTLTSSFVCVCMNKYFFVSVVIWVTLFHDRGRDIETTFNVMRFPQFLSLCALHIRLSFSSFCWMLWSILLWWGYDITVSASYYNILWLNTLSTWDPFHSDEILFCMSGYWWRKKEELRQVQMAIGERRNFF